MQYMSMYIALYMNNDTFYWSNNIVPYDTYDIATLWGLSLSITHVIYVFLWSVNNCHQMSIQNTFNLIQLSVLVEPISLYVKSYCFRLRHSLYLKFRTLLKIAPQ